MTNRIRQNQLVDRIVKALAILIAQINGPELSYFEQQLQPLQPRLQHIGIHINFGSQQSQTRPRRHVHEHGFNPINRHPEENRLVQRPRFQANSSVPGYIEEDDTNTNVNETGTHLPIRVDANIGAPALVSQISAAPSEPSVSAPESSPITPAEQHNTSSSLPTRKVMRDMPLLARVVARILRYTDKPQVPTGDAVSIEYATNFQSQIEAELRIDMSLQGSSLQKLTRLRRLGRSYFSEIELMRQRRPRENEHAIKMALIRSLSQRLRGSVRLFRRLCKEIEIVDMISKAYSQKVNEINEIVLLAISTECYAMSLPNAEECMDKVKWFTPWLTSITSPSESMAAGFRIPEGLLTDPSATLSAPPEALALEHIPQNSALWDSLDERYLVISGDGVFSLCALDAKTIIGEIHKNNKLGLIRESPEGNCRRFHSDGKALLIAIVDIHEISELLIKQD
ncbi:hypothetical protein TWF481_002783 [Arthrobotrys musiformis]|uniref:Uncharacterized protein n=1 Tax=Arthrobotrys musiformis TaxID=47236 RepID=A0AAV9VR84_9PEZI